MKKKHPVYIEFDVRLLEVQDKNMRCYAREEKVGPVKSLRCRTALLHCEPAQLSFDGWHRAKADLIL